jgi:hypothetical protein
MLELLWSIRLAVSYLMVTETRWRAAAVSFFEAVDLSR